MPPESRDRTLTPGHAYANLLVPPELGHRTGLTSVAAPDAPNNYPTKPAWREARGLRLQIRRHDAANRRPRAQNESRCRPNRETAR